MTDAPEKQKPSDEPSPMVVVIKACTVEQARIAGKAMAEAAGISGTFVRGTLDEVYRKMRRHDANNHN